MSQPGEPREVDGTGMHRYDTQKSQMKLDLSGQIYQWNVDVKKIMSNKMCWKGGLGGLPPRNEIDT